MPHLDRFLSALLTNGATALLLQADDCAQFDFAGSPRPVTKQPITGSQLAALMKEIAPADLHGDIDAGRDITFKYRTTEWGFNARYGLAAGRLAASIRPESANGEDEPSATTAVATPASAAEAVAAAANPARAEIRVNADSEPADSAFRDEL